MSARESVEYCGCCGLCCRSDYLWCDGCDRHVLPDGPLWERTWYAQKKEPCPFATTPGGGYGSGKALASMPQEVAVQHFEERTAAVAREVATWPTAEKFRFAADLIDQGDKAPAGWALSVARHALADLERRG